MLELINSSQVIGIIALYIVIQFLKVIIPLVIQKRNKQTIFSLEDRKKLNEIHDAIQNKNKQTLPSK